MPSSSGTATARRQPEARCSEPIASALRREIDAKLPIAFFFGKCSMRGAREMIGGYAARAV